jgi:hypothetical protein
MTSFVFACFVAKNSQARLCAERQAVPGSDNERNTGGFSMNSARTNFKVQVAFAALMLTAFMPAVAQSVAPLPERVTPAKTWTDHTWSSPDGTQFHYVEQGHGTPVILIHGLTSSAVSNWFNPGIAQKLAKTNRVIAIDMRGHGDTGPEPGRQQGNDDSGRGRFHGLSQN